MYVGKEIYGSKKIFALFLVDDIVIMTCFK